MRQRETGRKRRHMRIRSKVIGTPERLRLSVRRTGKHMYAQVIDDLSGTTVVSCSTLAKDLDTQGVKSSTVAAAALVGKQVAELAKAKGVGKVVFDRGGCLFHGRVKALAEGAREGGLAF